MRNPSRFALPLAVALFSISTMAAAVQVPGVYNTGLGVNGAELGAGDGRVDANYTVTASTDPSVVIGAQALTYYNPAYLQDGPLSRIVNATGSDGNGSVSNTTFSTNFSLVGYDFANASISGQVLFDNIGDIFLNNNRIVNAARPDGSFSGFGSLTGFVSSSGFVQGLNTLSFVLNNAGGPAAFQVAGLTVTAAALPSVGGVPEPASWAMLIAGFGLTGAAMRRRAAAPKTVAA
jgi:hypothetical protein